MKKLLSLCAAVALLLSCVGCGGKDEKNDALSDASRKTASDAEEKLVAADDAAKGEKEVYAAEGVDGDVAAAPDIATVGGRQTNGTKSNTVAEAGTLTAGVWNDNESFAFITELLRKNADFSAALKEWGFSIGERYTVQVTNGSATVQGAEVILKSGDSDIYTAVTDNTGTAYLFRNFASAQDGKPTSIAVKRGNSSATVNISEQQTEYSVELHDDSAPTGKSLDLMLVFDTTGSMSDELTYIQKEFEDIVNRVKSDNGNIPVRLSVNFYRDEGDEYVTKAFEFTDNIPEALDELSKQRADGGGDIPEAVDKALDDAINAHDWSDSYARLLVLVLDAPPHTEAKEKLASVILQAAEKGIRIIPVVASGSDTTNEVLMRVFAMATGGTYSFLTDDSGVGESHAEPTVGSYTVEKLNSLLVRIINSYLE